jgi:hypothetical protein
LNEIIDQILLAALTYAALGLAALFLHVVVLRQGKQPHRQLGMAIILAWPIWFALLIYYFVIGPEINND